MDSLGDILGNHRFEPPDEIKAIKNYLQNRYGSDNRVQAQDSLIIISVPSSALAGTLQLERNKIIKACGIKKRLVIRVGR